MKTIIGNISGNARFMNNIKARHHANKMKNTKSQLTNKGLTTTKSVKISRHHVVFNLLQVQFISHRFQDEVLDFSPLCSLKINFILLYPQPGNMGSF